MAEDPDLGARDTSAAGGHGGAAGQATLAPRADGQERATEGAGASKQPTSGTKIKQ